MVMIGLRKDSSQGCGIMVDLRDRVGVPNRKIKDQV